MRYSGIAHPNGLACLQFGWSHQNDGSIWTCSALRHPCLSDVPGWHLVDQAELRHSLHLWLAWICTEYLVRLSRKYSSGRSTVLVKKWRRMVIYKQKDHSLDRITLLIHHRQPDDA